MKKKRTFRKFTYRGVDLDQLLDMNNEQLMELFPCRIRRKIGRGLKRKPMALIKKLRKKKKECPINEKPDVVKTHLRDMIIVPKWLDLSSVYTMAKPPTKLKSSQKCLDTTLENSSSYPNYNSLPFPPLPERANVISSLTLPMAPPPIVQSDNSILQQNIQVYRNREHQL